MTRNHLNGTVLVDYRQRKDFASELRVFLLTQFPHGVGISPIQTRIVATVPRPQIGNDNRANDRKVIMVC
jgi:hypothetical protein